MWLRHWNLKRHPFDDRQASFVDMPGHAEAVARLVHTIESAGRSARLIAGPGLGKSTVLARALEATRSPGRRFSRVTGPVDGPELFASLAAGLGAKVALDASRSTAWRILGESARLCRWQGLHLVLSIDDCQELSDPSSRLDLERLDHLDPDPSTKLTILRIGRPLEVAESPSSDWGLSIRLELLTRSEASRYVEARLEAAGRPEPSFTPRALTRLHALSGGVPRGIDRLATLSLMAAALRRLEVVPPEVVDATSRECLAHQAVPSDA
jgi:type II secretory pathway predicted ATPase ExeA